MGYEQNANKLPPGKLLPEKVGDKAPLDRARAMQSTISDEGREFKVMLEDYTTAIVPEKDLVDAPKEDK